MKTRAIRTIRLNKKYTAIESLDKTIAPFSSKDSLSKKTNLYLSERFLMIDFLDLFVLVPESLFISANIYKNMNALFQHCRCFI